MVHRTAEALSSFRARPVRLQPGSGRHRQFHAATKEQATYSFVVRTRKGLEPLLRHELGRLPGLQDLQGSGESLPKHIPARNAFEEQERFEAAVEVEGPWSALYVLQLSRLAQSVSVRVCPKFHCKEVETLLRTCQEARWRELLPPEVLPNLPSKVWVWESQLRESQIQRALYKALRWVQAGAADGSRDRQVQRGEGGRAEWSGWDLGLRVMLHHNECSLELSCTGRLGVRPFVYSSGIPHNKLAPPIPTPYREEALATQTQVRARPVAMPWSLRAAVARAPQGKPAGPARAIASRADLVAAEWHGTKDLEATYAAALVYYIPLKQLLAEPSGLVVWDPFCANGTLLLEVLGRALGLPPASPYEPLPATTLLPHSKEAAARAAQAITKPLDGFHRLCLVGSDRSMAAVLRSRRMLHRFSRYYQAAIPPAPTGAAVERGESVDLRSQPKLLTGPTILGEVNKDSTASTTERRPVPLSRRRRAKKDDSSAAIPAEKPPVSTQQLPPNASAAKKAILTTESLQTFSSSTDSEWDITLPCEVSFNVGSFESLGPFLAGPLVVTKLPNEIHAFGPTPRIAHLYRRFGHFLAGRRDLCGAYVLTDNTIFQRLSRMSWEVLLKFIDHAGRRWQLLYWRPSMQHGHRNLGRAPSPTSMLDTDERQSKGREFWQRRPGKTAYGRPRIRLGRRLRVGS